MCRSRVSQQERMVAWIGLGLVLASAGKAQADWPQFRGPNGSGSAAERGLPTTWGPDENIVWKTELPGPGSSSPIVVGDKIFLTCYSGYGIDGQSPGSIEDLKRHLLALDRASGKILWQKESIARQPEQEFGRQLTLHGYASSTPASDGSAIYVFYGKSGVLAYGMDGELLWQRLVGDRTNGWGSSNSPVMYQGLVIVNASIESNSLYGLDKETGKVVWQTPGVQASWNTPLLVEGESGQTELIVNSRGSVLGLDPKTGKEQWRCQGIQDYVCPSLIAHQGVVYAIGGRSNTAIAIRTGGQGDVTTTHVLWKIARGSNVSSPVYHGGYLFWMHESRGIAFCVHAKSGNIVYEKRLSPNPGLVYASATVADDKIYYVSRENGTIVLPAKPDFEILAHNKLEKSVFNASPVISDGQLLLRSNRYLYCIDEAR